MTVLSCDNYLPFIYKLSCQLSTPYPLKNCSSLPSFFFMTVMFSTEFDLWRKAL